MAGDAGAACTGAGDACPKNKVSSSTTGDEGVDKDDAARAVDGDEDAARSAWKVAGVVVGVDGARGCSGDDGSVDGSAEDDGDDAAPQCDGKGVTGAETEVSTD